MAKITYPFTPKSTTYMREGQFWDVPLTDGRFACGRVLQFEMRNGKRDSRSFLAGLIDWCGGEPPSSESIAGCRLLEQGDVHIRTIAWNGGIIRGCRPLEEDGIEPVLELSQMPGRGCWVLRGSEWLRPASIAEQQTLDVHSTWGLAVISVAAEMYFVRGEIPPRRSPWDEHLRIKEYADKLVDGGPR